MAWLLALSSTRTIFVLEAINNCKGSIIIVNVVGGGGVGCVFVVDAAVAAMFILPVASVSVLNVLFLWTCDNNNTNKIN